MVFRRILHTPIVHYFTGGALVLVATAVAWFVPELKIATVLLLVAPVMLTAWLGGMGAALFTTSLAVLALNWVTFEPRFSFGVVTLSETLDLSVFTSVALLTSWLAKKRRQAETGMRQFARQLQAADRQKDEFLATLVHELRNPLSPIQGATELIELKCARGSDKDLKMECRIIRDQVAQLVRLVEDLTDISRIRSGKIQIEKEVLDLRSITTAAAATCDRLIRQRGHELSVSLPGEPVQLDADPTRLRQVLVNLLNNAAKYTDQGGKIQLVVERERNAAIVRVRDTGVGISADMLPHIFELFTQVDSSLDRSQGGLGIGLAVVRRLVELHGGTIAVRSAGLGRGSEFIVRLPILSDSPAAESELASPAESGRA